MSFTIKVERTKPDGETVLDTYEGVTDFMNPPMVERARLTFADGESGKLVPGRIINISDETSDN